MSLVGGAVPRVDVLLSKAMVEDVSIKISKESEAQERCSDKRLSRVSRLRDMFQTGVIRPVEELDNTSQQMEPSETYRVDSHNHFLRTFPGSPPLSALRSHRSRVVQQPDSSAHGSISDSLPIATPPARPPKPRHLTLDSSVALKPPATFPKVQISSEPKKPISDVVHKSDRQDDSSPSRTSTGSVSNLAETIVPGEQTASNQSDAITTCNSTSESSSLITSPDSCRTTSAKGLDVPLLDSDTPISLDPVVVPNESGDTPSECHNSGVKLEGDKLSSCSALNGISPPVADEIPPYQDFILNSEAFCNSSQLVTETVTTSSSLPGLQHAEPIAVVSPDEDDSEDTGSGYPTGPLPVPTGLKVLGVDSNGVHFLEDGNFFYTVEGLSSRPDSPVDSDFHKLSSCGFAFSNIKEEYSTGAESATNATGCFEATSTSEPSLAESNSDGLGKRVRFSTEPIVVFSTHSTSEYNRRNEDINPLAASAEYELEKQLEDMELFNVDLVRSSTGLGISILGLGVDNIGGDQKLGIFIKALTPGGAAEANGQIQVFDQIVEVNGINLVGVSQQFASQTLRNTRDVVHFVLARERDPANSRIAQLINEHEEDYERRDASFKDWHNLQSSNSPVHNHMDHHPTCSPDGSAGALHRLLTDAEQAARISIDSVSDVEEVSEENEEESTYSVCGKIDSNNVGLLFTTNPLFVSGAEELSLHAAPNRMASSSSSDQNGWMDSSKPPSVLKGTATAASTKRRQDAVLRLIRVAQQRAEADRVDPESSAGFTPTDPVVDRTAWILANELHDCHVQLSKLHTQVQQLEQRLTAQEAAADEAIERLCLQRQHVMLELNESRERLKQCIATQIGHSSSTESSFDNPPSINGRIPSTNSLTDESHATPSSVMPNVEAIASSSDSIGRVQFLESTHTENGLFSNHLPPSPTNSTPAFAPHASKRMSTSNASFSSHFSPLNCHGPTALSYLEHAYRRVRLISSGSLARRRPPTRLMVNSAPGFPPESSSSMCDVCPALHAAPTASSPTAKSPFASPTSELDAITSSKTDPKCPQVPTSSGSPPSYADTNQVHSTKYADVEHIQQTSRKSLGVQLPGLSAETISSVTLRHRSATSSPSTVDDSLKDIGHLLSSPERKISRI